MSVQGAPFALRDAADPGGLINARGAVLAFAWIERAHCLTNHSDGGSSRCVQAVEPVDRCSGGHSGSCATTMKRSRQRRE